MDESQKEIKIPYTIKSRRGSRSLRIAVHADGKVVVTKPFFVSVARAELFVQQKSAWIKAKMDEFAKKPQKLLAHYSAKDFKENKLKAYKIISERVAELNQSHGYEIKNIIIRNQKSRWGSCSGKKNLSFNYKIIFLPQELQDYIIIHELCHLKEMNHSRRFWSLVVDRIPDYKTRQNMIKLY